MAKKTLRVALVMGGGVSLGAFSGGALSEVVRQLCCAHNQTYSEVVFDVFSGASAGGITLALLLRALANPEDKPVEAVIQDIEYLERLLWVEQTGIQSLLPGRRTQPAAILSRKRLEAMVVEEPGLRWPDGAEPHHSGLLADRVCFGVSLMNYNGLHIKGTDDPALQDAKSTTLYGDYRYFCLDFTPSQAASPLRPSRHFKSHQIRQADTWYELYSTAVAGGAFPIAFEPVVLEREKDEFPEKTWPDELGEAPFRFTYGDGGAFNNEPLREAMRMIAYQDGYEMNKPWQGEERQDVSISRQEFDRILVYIDPDLAGSSSQLELSMHVSPGSRERILASGVRLITAIRGQAAFKDVLTSSEVDNRLKWRRELRDLLLSMVDQLAASSPGSEARLGAEKKLKEVLKAKGEASGRTYRHTKEIERVYWEEHKAAAKPYGDMTEPEIERYSLLALVDQVAALRAKQEIKVIAIAPGEERDRIKLAGDFLAGFGGFLEQSYRDHDYRVGQAKARSVLSRVRMGPPDAPYLLDESTRAPLPARPKGELETQVVQSHRQENASQIGHRIRQVVQLFLGDSHNWFTRQLGRFVLPLADGRIKKGLSKALKPTEEKKERRARLRIIVEFPFPGGYRLRLAGSEGALPSPPAKTDASGNAVLETGITFSEHEIRGKHVFHKKKDPGRAWARIVLRKRPFGRVTRDVRLPDPGQLWAVKPKALHVEELVFSWTDAQGQAEITTYERLVKDQLETHAESLRAMAGKLQD